MARTTINFADVPDGFEAVPEDEYSVVIEKAEYKEASQEGKYDYINLTLKITDEGEYKDRLLWMIMSFSPKSLWRMKQVFENLNIISPDAELDIEYDDESKLVTTPELVGVPGTATVSIRQYEGKDSNQVDALTASDLTPQKKAPGRAKRKLT